MEKTFQDPGIEAEFTRRGYVVLPFLDLEAVEALRTEFQNLRPSDGYGGWQDTALGRQSFHVTFFDTNPAYRLAVFDLVKNRYQPFADQHFVDHRMVQGNVFLKPPRQGFVHPHQNLTITDESRFRSVSLWCPLQDTRYENGTLCVVPGSQNGFMRFRNTKIYWPLIAAFREGPAHEFLLPIDVKAGEVVVLDDRLIHATPENRTDAARWVMHALWLPQAAPLRYFDLEVAAKRVVEYAVSDDFWQMYAPGTDPVGLQALREHPYAEPQFTEAELLAFLHELRLRAGVLG